MPTSRVQLALNVEDLSAATSFYSKLFGVTPHKQRPGYANFVVGDPPLELVLFESADADQRLNHLGVEAATTGDVQAALVRFRAAGLDTTVATQDLCCHVLGAVGVPTRHQPIGHHPDVAGARRRLRPSACCAVFPCDLHREGHGQ
jgi:catechol 2,3-dioxygenase-like lactoylglutathione lyase family enzyme